MQQLPDPNRQQPHISLKTSPKLGFWIFLLDTVSVLFWTYVITSLFIFDLTRYAFEKILPDYAWILDFKVVFFLGIAAFAAIFMKKTTLVFWIVYVLAFPIVLIIWKIPKHVFKTGSLNIIFYFFFTAVGFFKSIKQNIFICFISITSSLAILFSNTKWILYAGSVALFAVMLFIFANRIISILKPGDTFILFRKLTGWWQKQVIQKVEEDKEFQQLSLISPDNKSLQTIVSNVEMALISNRAILFSAKSLRTYQNSGITAISGVFVTTFMFAITTICFSLIYYAVFKIDPSNYTFAIEPSGFAFFSLSFKAMFFTTINELNPSTPLSQSVNIAQNFVSLFIGVIFVSIIFTSRNQVLSYQLDETINKLQDDGNQIEKAIFGRYKINSIEELIFELRRLKTSGLAIVDFFTSRL